jgi:hypothetical protein
MPNDALIQAGCFFDLFDFPLTSEELVRYAYGERVSSNAKTELLSSAPATLSQSTGYYFLRGREELVNARRQKTALIDQKIRRARRAAKWISSVPFVRAIFVCNSVAFETASKESDIDFFIIAAPGRIWLVRFFTNLILKLTGQRVGSFHSANKICLSFYTDSDHLNLESLCLPGGDVYMAYWLCTLLALYDPSNIQTKLIAENRWLAKIVPGAWEELRNKGANTPVAKSRWQRAWEAMWQGSYGDLLEKEVKRIQESHLSSSLKAAAKSGSGVIISDSMLKFHEHDRRPSIQAAWLANIKKYDSKN